MRWRRLCVDMAEDGECISGSVEWHPDTTEDLGPEAITVLPYMPGATPERVFVAVLAVPWYQPALPFPPSGWTHLGTVTDYRGDPLRRKQKSKKW